MSSTTKAKGSGLVSVTDTIAAIEREAASQASARLAEYEALVAAAVTGQDVDPATAARVLHDAGKKPAEFRAEVDRRQARGPLLAKVESLPAVELAALKIREELQDHDRKRAQIIGELDAESLRLNFQYRTAIQKVHEAYSAGRTLRDTYRGPLLKDLDAALARLNDAANQLKLARNEVDQVRAAIAAAEATNASGSSQTEYDKGQIADAKARLTLLEADVATLTETRSQLAAEADRIAAQTLTA